MLIYECILLLLCEQITATHLWVTYALVGIYFVLLPIWTTVVMYNNYTRPVLKTGWIPVLSALFISGYVHLSLNITICAHKIIMKKKKKIVNRKLD